MKNLIHILLLATLILSLTACGRGNASENLEEPTDKIEEKSLETNAETEVIEEVTENETEASSPFENIYPAYILGESDTKVTYMDTFGKETTITKNPEKTVVLYNSLLGLWYYMGGESVAKVKGTTNVPEEAMDLVDLGSYSSVSLEAIVALEPSLVIIASNVSATVEMAANLEEMGIETMIVDSKYRSYDRFKENAYLFSKVLGTEDLFYDKTDVIIKDVQNIIDQSSTAQDQPKVAPLFVTSTSISIETDIAQVGEMVTYLNGENIFIEEDLKAEGETRIPFSIEALVTQNPEVILITTMGSVEGAQATMEAMIEENPVWMEVDAVKNGRVHYLDKDLSVYKPNQRYAEAFKMIADLLYPELF